MVHQRARAVERLVTPSKVPALRGVSLANCEQLCGALANSGYISLGIADHPTQPYSSLPE